MAPVRASSFTPRSRVGRGGRGVVQEETHGRVQSELRDGVRLARPGDGDESDAGKEASRTDAPRIEFEGGVVMITHDAHICEQVLDDEKSEIWVVDEGRVDKFNGDFAEYRKQLVAEIAAELDDDE